MFKNKIFYQPYMPFAKDSNINDMRISSKNHKIFTKNGWSDIEKKKHETKAVDFEVGQRVWEFQRGWGVVVDINLSDEEGFNVTVKFDKNGVTYTYTVDGRFNVHLNRTLFFDEIPVPENALIPPKKWRAKYGETYYFVDTVGKVRCSYDGDWKLDKARYEIGNYFQTESKAKGSDLYKMFNGGDK